MTKQQNSTILSPLKTTYALRYFKNHSVDTKAFIATSLGMLILLGIVNIIRANFNYTPMGPISAFFTTVIGAPLLLSLVYLLLHTFIAAFQGKAPAFWKSLLVFLTITLPLMFVGNLANFLRQVFSYQPVLSVIGWLVLLLIFTYLIVNIIFHLKYAMKTTFYRVIASLLLVHFIFLGLGMINYVAMLISRLQ